MSDAADPIQAIDLAARRLRQVEEVKRAPADAVKRLALADTLIVLGEWDRADTHLDLASTQDPSWGQVCALLRQLVRAAAHRGDVFAHGRPPDLVTEPTPRVRTALEILAAGRAGGDAAALRRAADERFAPLAVELDGAPAQGVRDGDDRLADVLEIMTSTGKYVWISYDQVSALELRPVEHPRDRIWRPAELDVVDGPTGVVYLPMIYPATATTSDAQRLGRETDWIDHGGLDCGVGQKCLLIGEELVALSDIGALSVDLPAGPSAE